MIGLPSLRAFDHQQSARIWLAATPVDMRCGFDRLEELARAVTGQDPFHAHLFLFLHGISFAITCSKSGTARMLF